MAAAMYRLSRQCRILPNFSPIQSKSLSPRYFHTSLSRTAAYDAEFEQAKKKLDTLKNDPGNQVKLQIYALFKQSTSGVCNTPKPGMMDFVGKAKWEAWSKLGSMSQDDAQKQYIDLVESLVAEEGGGGSSAATEEPSQQAAGPVSGDIIVENRDNMCVMRLNRPDKKNAITRKMYTDIADILKNAAANDNVRLAVMTGTGDFYSSGNDLSNFTELDPSNLPEEAKIGAELLRDFVDAFINFPKPLIGVVNGPAVGIAATTLGLMDAVYCSDKATFQTPFSSLGQSPEACSSYIFPKLMGNLKASELLMFNKKISAGEALERNMVSQVFPNASFDAEVWPLIQGYAQLPKESMRFIKGIIRSTETEKLLAINKEECDLLEQRWQSQECLEAVMKFFSK